MGVRNAKAVLTCTHNLCFEKNYQYFSNEIFNFYGGKESRDVYCIHGKVFIMMAKDHSCMFQCFIPSLKGQ